MRTSLITFALFALTTLLPEKALAEISIEPWTAIYKGVMQTTGQADTNEVRLHKVFALRVDLWDPDIEFFSTPSNGGNPKETDGQTTTTFVNAYTPRVAINANFFSPVSTIPGEPRDIEDLAISQGTIVSPADGSRVRVLITRDNQVSFTASSPGNLSGVWTAVAGSDLILINGVPQLAGCDTWFCGPNPRTAVGLSQNGRFFFMVVIDGRQPGWSDGSTLYETGQWLLRLGAWNAVNLDGGGSTAMVKLENGSAVLMNRPSEGEQRVNGNHLGLYTKELPPYVSAGPTGTNALIGGSVTFRVAATGSTPLGYQWRRNGDALPGATNSSLTLGQLTPEDAGNYTVTVTNGAGAATSTPAMLHAHYLLTTTNTAGGEILRIPNQPSYPPGASVTLSPLADPGFSFTGWRGTATPGAVPLVIQMDGHKTLGAEFAGSPPDIILDNTNAVLTGLWTTYANLGDAYGPSFYGCAPVAVNATPTHTATYRPFIFTPGRYAVYSWHPAADVFSSGAPWTVGFDAGTASVLVDQTRNGGSWQLAFTGQDFLPGTNGLVRLGNNAGGVGKVVADAIKLVYGIGRGPRSIGETQGIGGATRRVVGRRSMT